MIKLKEIPIGELTRQMLNNQFVYAKYNNNPLKKVATNTSMELGEIELTKFFIEDKSEGESELTYGDIYKEFLRQHEGIDKAICDYRPVAGKPFTFTIWLEGVHETQPSIEITYHPDSKTFTWRKPE